MAAGSSAPRSARYPMQLPVLYRIRTEGARRRGARRAVSSDVQWRAGLTSNLSASGILFITMLDAGSVPALHAVIEIKVLLPAAANRRAPRASCIGRIVRVETPLQPHHGTAVAATIESYQIESHGANGVPAEVGDADGGGCTVH